jgi:hypothetical protein
MRTRVAEDDARLGSLLDSWLKHDLVFFGEGYLCEDCAKAGGFI